MVEEVATPVGLVLTEQQVEYLTQRVLSTAPYPEDAESSIWWHPVLEVLAFSSARFQDKDRGFVATIELFHYGDLYNVLARVYTAPNSHPAIHADIARTIRKNLRKKV